MTKPSKDEILRKLCEQGLAAHVLSLVADYCEQQANHCQTVEELKAIGGEWKRACTYIRKAIDEISQ